MAHMEGLITAWGKILRGIRPSLSIEITRECPLRCPGCYAYGDEHLGGDVNLRQVTDYKGDELVKRVLALVDEENPIHVSIVGGEPLVRSIDGLQPEHDKRRTPATYDRIQKHIAGHEITVHCTVTRQQVQRDGYLEEFARLWSENPNVSQLWFSLYTPQIGEVSDEMLRPHDRERVVAALMSLRRKYKKIAMPEGLVKQYATPPSSPDDCIFAQTTTCISADFEHRITPCQFGGNPDCSQCGCIASAALKAVGAHRLAGGIRVGAIFESSL